MGERNKTRDGHAGPGCGGCGRGDCGQRGLPGCGEHGRAAFDPLAALTVRDVGGLLNVSRPTVEKHIGAGELPSILIGRCRRILRSDLQAFLDRRTAWGWRPYSPKPNPPADGPPEGDDIPF